MNRKLSKAGWVIILAVVVIVLSIATTVVGFNLNSKLKNEIKTLTANNEKLTAEVEDLKIENSALKTKINELTIIETDNTKEEENNDPVTKKYTVISKTGLNIREKASTDSEVVKVLKKDETFEGEEMSVNNSIWVKMSEGYVCIKTSEGIVLAE